MIPELVRHRAAEHVPSEDQARVVEVVETEMMSRHEGNIARYRLRPAEYPAGGTVGVEGKLGELGIGD